MRFINIDINGKIDNKEPFFLKGTKGQGMLANVKYEELVRVFGQPNGSTDGNKIDAEWVVFTPAGIASIYNYKDGENYLGESGQKVKDIESWHIGGKTPEVLGWIKKALGLEA